MVTLRWFIVSDKCTYVLFPNFFWFKFSVEAVLWSFLSVAIWWGVFTVPLITGVKEKQEEDSKKIYSLLEETHLKVFIRLENLSDNIKAQLFSYWLIFYTWME